MKKMLVISLLALLLGWGAFSLKSASAADCPNSTLDSDHDGLTNCQEQLLGTNPNNPDTDGDGISDGVEYWQTFTNPLQADSDGDGIPDGSDPYPRHLLYQDLSGVTTDTDSILQGKSEGPTGWAVHQKTVVRVGDVITIDWWDYIDPQKFVLRGAKLRISFDFADPNRKDFTANGSYQVNVKADTAHIILPLASGQILDRTIPWKPDSMTISDWAYHLYSKPLKVGQTYDFHVFYPELLASGEDPFFSVHAQVTGVQKVPLDSRLGRREYQVYQVKATFRHVPFKDPFFAALLGPKPQLDAEAWITVKDGVLLRYTTPFFRTSPVESVGFSDFIVQH